MATRNQVAAIQVGRRALGLAEADYRAILGLAGASSSRELDSVGFEMVIEHFRALGWEPAFRRGEFFGTRRNMATPGQVTLIRALWDEYTGEAGTDLTLGKFLHRTFGVSSLRFVTAEQAPKAIAALKAMTGRRAAGTACPPPQRTAGGGAP